MSSLIQDLNRGSFNKLDNAADDYFSKVIPQQVRSVASLNDLLNTSFIVAENHYNVSPKSFLIRNMSLLKQAGFNTLFIEGLYYEHQQAIDNFCLNSEVTQLAAEVSNRLDELDRGCFYQPTRLYDLHERWQANNYSSLIKAAKHVGMRIVGIDTKATLTFSLEDRCKNPNTYGLNRIKYMNFTAAHIIKEVTKYNQLNDKWLLLTGAFHAVTLDHSIFGMSDIMGVPSVYVEDTAGLLLNQRILYNSSHHTHMLCSEGQKLIAENFLVKEISFNVYITNNPFRDMPLICSPKISDLFDCNDLPVLTENQFNDAVNKYVAYKDEYMGLRWFSTSDESRNAMYKIILADNGQERFKIAEDYISKNPDKELSLRFQNAMRITD
jgi:hypothetical protein